MRLAAALEGVERVFLDTAPAIYFFERNPAYFGRMDAFPRIRRERNIVIVTSAITLAECLVHPIRNGLEEQAAGFRRLILESVGTEFHTMGSEAAELAARLRARMTLPLMDALQVGCAIATGCQVLLTNDRRLSRVDGVRILVVDDLEH